jgi:thiol-disulfide isomerase/thioredoxin
MLRALAYLFTVALFPLIASGQVTSVKPDQSKWGETLTVTYDSHAPGAKLPATDDIYVQAKWAYPDSSRDQISKMNKVGDLFTAKFSVQPNLAYVRFYFITLSDWDKNATVSTMIYRLDGVPVKGAYQKSLGPGVSPKEVIGKELALYPDNYSVYVDKWLYATERDQRDAVIKEDIARLNREVRGEPADFLYALIDGYILLKQEKESREALKKLITLYPSSQLTTDALLYYQFQVFKQQIKGDGPDEVEQLKWKLFGEHPGSSFAQLTFTEQAENKEVPLATLEAIGKAWIAEEQANPLPYIYLAAVYNSRKQKVGDASSLIEKGINLLLQNRLRLYRGIGTRPVENYLSSAYLTAGGIFLQQREYAKALSSAKAAQALERESSQLTYLLEAQIWQELKNDPLAEVPFLIAWRRGAPEAEAALKTIYQKRNGNLNGFQEYLVKKSEAASSSSSGKTNATTFKVTSLDGQTFDLSALKGKVVVLNFWFIGCAPCQVEMPGLNQVVKEFKDKDVVFIAFANDDEKALRTFLNKKEFHYNIIASAEQIAQEFGVSAYPTHVIIDRQGRIFVKIAGGDEKRSEDLRLLIARVLNEG